MTRIWSRQRATGVVLCVAVGLAVAACSSTPATQKNNSSSSSNRYNVHAPNATKQVDLVTWNSAYGEPTTLDPARAFNNQNMIVISNMCEPLMQAGPDGTVKPNLAESMVASPDGLSYTFKIRQGVTFWDGSPMTADDVAWSINHARDKSTGSFVASAMAAIQSVQGQGDTVVVTLSKPDALVPKYFAMQGGVVVSKAFATSAGAKYGTIAAGTMCTGPYEWPKAGWKSGAPLTLTRADSYWNKDLPLLTKAIKFEFITDTSTMVNAFRTGDVDGGFQIPGSAITSLSAANGKVYYAHGRSSLNLITVGNNSPLANPVVRRALSMAISRQQIVDTIWAGTADPLRASAPPTTWTEVPAVYQAAWDKLGGADGNVDAAKAELKGVSGLDGAIHIAIPAQTENYVKQGEEFQSVGKELGLNIVLDQMPTAEYGGLFADPAARAKYNALFVELPLYIPEAISLYQAEATPNGQYNYSQYSSAQVTALIAQAVSEPDPAKRAGDTVQVQDQLSKDLPWIPVIAPDVTMFLRNGLGGQALSSNIWYPFAAYLGGV